MDNKCLLTYDLDGQSTYAWFQDDEELEMFVRQQMSRYGMKFKVNEAIEIEKCTEICLL